MDANRVFVSDVARSPLFAGKESGEMMRGSGVAAVQSTPVKDFSGGRLVGIVSTDWRAPPVLMGAQLGALDPLIHRTATKSSRLGR